MSLDEDVRREFPLTMHDFGWMGDVKREYGLKSLVEVAESYMRSLRVLRGCYPDMPTGKVKQLAYERVENTYKAKKVQKDDV